MTKPPRIRTSEFLCYFCPAAEFAPEIHGVFQGFSLFCHGYVLHSCTRPAAKEREQKRLADEAAVRKLGAWAETQRVKIL